MISTTYLSRALLAAGLVATASGQAELQTKSDMTLQEALTGNKLPSMLSSEALTPDFTAIELVNSPDKTLHRLESFGGRRLRRAASSFWGVLWTRFQKVRIEGHPYLVC